MGCGCARQQPRSFLVDPTRVREVTGMVGAGAGGVGIPVAVFHPGGVVERFTSPMAPSEASFGRHRSPRSVRTLVRVGGAAHAGQSASSVLDADGNFNASGLLSQGEQSASASLTQALSQELQAEGDAVAVASAFVAGLVGGETAIAAIAGGASVLAAAGAGVAAGEAAATAAGAAIATGPGAPIAIALFAVPLILVAVWGASAGYGCCGQPPDPRPRPLLRYPGDSAVETQAQATARATQEAQSANGNASCNGNTDYISAIGNYDTPAAGSFQEYAYAAVRGAVDSSQMLRCWPIAQINFAKLLAMLVDSWNATHAGPTTTIGVMIGFGEGPDPLTYAVRSAVPPDGSWTTQTVQPGQKGFNQTFETWGGMPNKVVLLQVNAGPFVGGPPPMPRPVVMPGVNLLQAEQGLLGGGSPSGAPSAPAPVGLSPGAATKRKVAALLLAGLGVAGAGLAVFELEAKRHGAKARER